MAGNHRPKWEGKAAAARGIRGWGKVGWGNFDQSSWITRRPEVGYHEGNFRSYLSEKLINTKHAWEKLFKVKDMP